MSKRNRPYLWQMVASVILAVVVSFPLEADGYYLFAIFMLSYIAIGCSMVFYRVYTMEKKVSDIERELAKVEVVIQAKNINEQIRIEKEKMSKQKK